MAPPDMAMIKKAAPVLVNLPRPSMAKGQIAGHTKAFAIPKEATNKTEVKPQVLTMTKLRMIPSKPLNLKAVV